MKNNTFTPVHMYQFLWLHICQGAQPHHPSSHGAETNHRSARNWHHRRLPGPWLGPLPTRLLLLLVGLVVLLLWMDLLAITGFSFQGVLEQVVENGGVEGEDAGGQGDDQRAALGPETHL